MNNKDASLICLGKSGRPYGLTGAFHFITNNNTRWPISKGTNLILYPIGSTPKPPVQTKIIAYNQHLTLECFSTPEEIKSFGPFDIYCKRSDLPPLTEDEFYLNDLIGLSVHNILHPDQIWGNITAYEQVPNTEQVFVTIETVNDPNEVHQLPFVKAFFPEVDFAKKIAYAHIPEYI